MNNLNVSTGFNELTATYHIWAGDPWNDPQPIGSVIRGHQITAEHMLQYTDGHRAAVSPVEWAAYESLMRTKQYGGKENVEKRTFRISSRDPADFSDFGIS